MRLSHTLDSGSKMFLFLPVSSFLLCQTIYSVTGLSCDNGPSSESYETLGSGANDVVAVLQADGSIKATPFYVQIGKLDNWRTWIRSREGRHVTIIVNGKEAPVKMTIGDSGMACFTRKKDKYTLRSNEIALLHLIKGINRGVYKVPSLKVEIPFLVYLLDQTDRLVITDVDGTITSADISGRIFPRFGFKTSHDGVVKLFDGAVRNGYTMIYLTARSMAEDSDTRDYLFEILDNTDGGYSLPFGPLLMSPKSVAEAIFEALAGPSRQKIETLNQVLSLFDQGSGVVEVAYGNRDSDETAYKAIGISPEKIFTVDEASMIRSSAGGPLTTYKAQSQRINDLFPKIVQ